MKTSETGHGRDGKPIPKGSVFHRRSRIRWVFSHIAHKRRNVRFKGLWRTHATPAPNRAHSGSQGQTRGVFTARDIGRVDRVNSLGTLCIVTFGTAQFDKPLSVAAAHHGGNADFA